MCAEEVRPRWKTLLAFAIIYFVWGSTFFAIRVGVAEIPPLLMAALRFGIAGLVMVGWSLARREATPRGREWGSVFLVALLIFVVDYGLLFWAEKRVPSGVAAVVLATIPAFMAVAEILFLGTQRMSWRLGLALVIGVLGVAVLTGVGGARFGKAAIDAAWAGLLVVAAVGWVVASVLTKKLPLPKSKAMSSGAQMLAGGLMCAVVSAGLGEWKGFRWSEVSGAAWLALGYLIVFGSILGFTAYVWLIHHESPTKVGTYAYVNPVVAVVVGYWLGGEPLGARTVAGSVLVLVSVAAITTAKKTAVPRQVEE